MTFTLGRLSVPKTTAEVHIGNQEYVEVDLGTVTQVLKELKKGGIKVEGKWLALISGGNLVST